MNPVRVTPKSPKGWLKTRIFTFDFAFHIFVAGMYTHFKCGVWVEHSKTQPTDIKPSLKWLWSRHFIHLKKLVPIERRSRCNGSGGRSPWIPLGNFRPPDSLTDLPRILSSPGSLDVRINPVGPMGIWA